MSSKSQSYAITVRPLNGLLPDTEKRIVSWLKKQNHAIAVIEMDDTPARHLHAQIWLSESRTKGSIKTTLQRICKATIPDWSSCQERVLNQGVKFAYNDNFYQEYLLDNPDKQDEVNIIYDSVPLDREQYYPSQEDQTKWQNQSSAVDKKLHRYKELWIEYAKDKKYPIAKPLHWMVFVFYNDACYGSKTIIVPKDDKTIKQNIKHLLRYIRGSGIMMSENDRELKDLYEEDH